MPSRAPAPSLRSAGRLEGDVWQEIAAETAPALSQRAQQRAARSRPWLQAPRPQPKPTSTTSLLPGRCAYNTWKVKKQEEERKALIQKSKDVRARCQRGPKVAKVVETKKELITPTASKPLKSLLRIPGSKGSGKGVSFSEDTKVGTTCVSDIDRYYKSRAFRERLTDPHTDEEAFRRLQRRCHDGGDIKRLFREHPSKYVSISGALVGWDEEGNTTWTSLASHAPCYDDHYRFRLGNCDGVAKRLEILDDCHGNYQLARGYIAACRRARSRGEAFPDVLTYLETCDLELYELPPTQAEIDEYYYAMMDW
ncbi:MAG: hypothetical protein M1836_006488 [Candelina mexicana]|nr:MAG: hypothetical protein M1836_006488 [Candelina mexicana]